MSIQESKLTEIADAIREKEGTSNSIPANQFADRISNLQLEPDIPEGIYKIDVSADPPEGGTVTGGGYAESGMEVIVEAGANDGYDFEGWYENNSIISTDMIKNIQVNKNYNLYGKFLPSKKFDWTLLTSSIPVAQQWYGFAIKNSFMICLASNSLTGIRSLDNGQSWTQFQTQSSTLAPITIGQSDICVNRANQSAYSNQLQYSRTSGTVWKYSVTIPVTSSINSTGVYNFNNFYTNSDDAIIKSTDGRSWETVLEKSNLSTMIGHSNFHGQEIIGNISIANKQALISYNGTDFTESTNIPSRESAYSNYLKMVVSENKIVALPSNYQTKVSEFFFSEDGLNWEKGNLPIKITSTYHIAYGDGRYLASTDMGFLESYNGINWFTLKEDEFPISSLDSFQYTFGYFNNKWYWLLYNSTEIYVSD